MTYARYAGARNARTPRASLNTLIGLPSVGSAAYRGSYDFTADVVELGGVATYLGDASDSKVTLFI